MARTNITGLSEALSTLRKIDPVLYREAQKNMRRDAKPLVDEARSNVPRQTPLSGWKMGGAGGTQRSGSSRFPSWESGVQRKINLRVRNERVKGTGGRRVLVRVVQGSASGSVFDMAGRKNSGNPIDVGLRSAGFGSASRSMWPAAEKHQTDVTKSIQKSVFDMEAIINAELKGRGYTRRRPVGSPHFR